MLAVDAMPTKGKLQVLDFLVAGDVVSASTVLPTPRVSLRAIWAWGEGFQGWLVDRGVIAHAYTEDQAWKAIDALTSRRWPTAGGSEVDVMSWGIDTGAFTQVLYDRVGGRHALLATKGDNRPSAAPFKKGRADLRDPRSGRPIAGRRLNLAFIGNFDLKLSVYEGLRSLDAGPELGGAWRAGNSPFA
jgi:phage terminase large subunit GpA-like protein